MLASRCLRNRTMSMSDQSNAPPSHRIPFHVPNATGNELQYLQEVLASRNLAGNGPFTKRVHEWLEKRYGVKRVLLTHSCTGALEMTALLLNLEDGDEVIVPSYTFCSTASAFARTRARIVFCEVDPQSLMIDPADVERRLTARTRAIVPVHYAGLACDIDRITALARQVNAVVIEDAAQGLDADAGGRPLGTIGEFGCLSFHETKNLHAGLCGALFINSNDVDLHERAIQVWERGTNRQAQLRGTVDKYTWTEIGSSFYPTELQAAFLLSQLEGMAEDRAARAPIHQVYLEGLRPLAERGLLGIPPYRPGDRINFHAFFTIFRTAEECNRVRLALVASGVSAYIGYVPLHSSPVGRRLGWSPEDLPVTEDVAQRVLRLPFHNQLTTNDAERVVELIARELGHV